MIRSTISAHVAFTAFKTLEETKLKSLNASEYQAGRLHAFASPTIYQRSDILAWWTSND